LALKEMYVVMLREHGLFLAEPVAGEEQRVTIEHALGLRGGYSGGLVELELPESDGEHWVAWVELETPSGRPTFEFRALDGSLTEEDATARLRAAGEEPLKLNRSPVYTIQSPRPVAPPEEEPEAEDFIP
jgi:hypothetical protein